MTPAAYLDSHLLTKLLKKRYRVVFDEISSVRIIYQPGAHPASWPMTSLTGFPPDVPRHLLRAYALLKWITFEDPPDSRDLDDATGIIKEALNSQFFDIGVKHTVAGIKGRKAQQELASENKAEIIAVFERLRGERQTASNNDLVARTVTETGKSESTVRRALRSKQRTVTGTD